MRDENVHFGRLLVAVWLTFAASQAFHYVVENCSYAAGYWCAIAICPVVAAALMILFIELKKYVVSVMDTDC